MTCTCGVDPLDRMPLVDAACPKHGVRRHATSGGLCDQDHICPNCACGAGPCLDLFVFPGCGLVACDEGADRCASS
jgi:hypothetical protein